MATQRFSQIPDPAPARGSYRVAPGLRAELPARAERAFVTLVTNRDYLPGAEALIRSLRLSGTGADIAVMHCHIPADGLNRIRALGARLIEAEPLPTTEEFHASHARDDPHPRAPLSRGTTPDVHSPLDNFIKLRLWQLDYARCVFIDADAIVLRPVDRLFDFPEFCAAPDVYDGLDGFHRMNSGVFTARPDPETFRRMLSRLDRPGQFWPRTDQSFLQDFFPDWYGLPIQYNLLQYVWLNLPKLWSWDDIHILHYQCEKPWQRHRKTQALAPLIQLWQQIAAGGPVPNLSGLMRPAA